MTSPIRNFLAAILCAALTFAVQAAALRPAPTVVVLLDQSASIPPGDRQVYAASFQNVLVATYVPGTRLTLGSIGEATHGRWVPLLDVRVPAPTGIELKDQKRLQAWQAGVSAAFAQAMEAATRRPDNRTRLTEAVAAASEAFAPSGQNTLVLLSDMDAAVGKAPPPGLAGVSVVVAGAGGAGDEFAARQARWTTYFETAGAKIVQYGRFPAQLPSRPTK